MAEIPIDKLLGSCFHDRKEYIEGLPKYSELQGSELEYKHMQLSTHADAPNSNPYLSVSTEVEERWSHVFSQLYNTDAELVDLKEVAVMITGRTRPLRGTAIVGGVEKVCYAKLPDSSRFFGLELFNIMSGYRPLDFIFEKNVFVSDSAPGKLEAHWDREELYSMKPFQENLVRLDTLARYCCINDLYHPHNKTVDSDGNIYVIDFDESLKYVTDSLSDSVDLPQKEVFAIVEDERNLIARRVHKELDRVQALVSMLMEHNYNEGEAAQYGSFKNMGEVVAHMLQEEGIKIK